MNKKIKIEQLFYNQKNSYDIVNKSKQIELSGYKYVIVNNLVSKLSIRYFMFIVVSLSKLDYELNNMFQQMKQESNWYKDKDNRYYKFKLLKN